MTVAEAVLDQRVYIVSFPKSGTHLMERWVQHLASPVTERNWLSNVRDAWTADLEDHAGRMPEIVKLFPAGGYLKGHLAWDGDTAEAMLHSGISTIFVHRNLRAVAVSIAHHVTSRDDKLHHFDKSLFEGMTPREAVPHVIRGIGEHGALADRWRMFSPWLNERWVLCVRFEDMVNRPKQTASKVLRYVAGFAARFAGVGLGIDRQEHDAAVRAMVKSGKRRDTVTFRKGTANGWRSDWSKQAERAFCATGCDVLNRQAGYA